MKKIIGILVALMMCFTLSSCVTEVQAQSDDIYYDDNIDVRLVITYGTPYYNAEGLILYYVYHNMYYYPYFYNDRYYFHRYHSPLPRHRLGVYKPVPRDFYRHQPGYYSRPPRDRNHRPETRPRPDNRQRPDARPRPDSRPRPNVQTRPNTQSRPNVQPRPSGGSRPSGNVGSAPRTTRSSGASGGGRFGGRR